MATSSTDVQTLRELHHEMVRIRFFEETAIRGQAEHLVLGPIHPYIGQEGVAAGVCANLRRDDIALSTHRGHGHTLAKGASPGPMMAELFGRVDGPCGGKGGSLHVADFSVGMLGANGVVSANIVIATGAAHAVKLAGDDRVVVCFFGDGAANRGPFLEGLNWSAVFELPVLFVCEDNTWSAMTPTAGLTGGTGLADRARSLGAEVTEVDGNDVGAVHEAAHRAIKVLRAGGKPQFLLATTYRLTGHTATDAGAYRDTDQVTSAWANEPIGRCRSALLDLGLAQASIDGDVEAARQEMDEAFRFAANSPEPESGAAYTDVQEVGDPRVTAF